MPKILNLKVLGLAAVLALFAILQWYKLAHLAPNPENIWDNVYLWDWARHLSQGKVGTFVDSSHHLMRWGDWTIPTVFIWLTSDSVLTYFLSTIIPSSIGLLIFTYLAHRYIGFTAALVFVVFCFFDALLFRATFQLLPSGQGLLPIALLAWLALFLNSNDRALNKDGVAGSIEMGVVWVVVATGLLFWVYGSKETHLAFAPGFLWVVYQRYSFKPVLQISLLFALLYVLETLAFIVISPTFPWLGRVYSLLNDGQHITIMLENAHYVAEQTRYFDSGITMRWARTSGMTPLIVFAGFLLAVFVFIEEQVDQRVSKDLRNVNYVFAVLFFSFIFFSTFFVISVNPIRLGHGLVPRYATLGLPFAYMLILGYGAQKVSGQPKRYAIALLAIVPFFLAPAIDRVKKYPDVSITQISRNYDGLGNKLADHDCVRARGRSILMNELDLVPLKFRDQRWANMITNDTLLTQENGWFVVKSAPNYECQSMYTIGRTATARY